MSFPRVGPGSDIRKRENIDDLIVIGKRERASESGVRDCSLTRDGYSAPISEAESGVRPQAQGSGRSHAAEKWRSVPAETTFNGVRP